MSTLQALEFTDVEGSTDSPDLAAFKLRVIAVAKKHSRDMHCGSVTSELRALGVQEEKKIKVTVTTSHPFTFVVSVEPSKLAGKTALEQATVLAGLIGKVNLSVAGSSGVSAVGLEAIAISPESVVSMSREVPQLRTPANGSEITLGEYDAWRYTSDDGRVLHLFRGLLDPSGHSVRYGTRNYVYSRCGTGRYSDYLRETSRRGTGAYCAKCSVG